jgi:uncharacterized repeat protein (TIGR01451 family)
MKNLRMSVLIAMVVSLGLVSCPSAWGVTCFHGITLQKNATSPVSVGSPYQAAYFIGDSEPAQDGQQVTSLIDTIQTSGGDVNSGNILTMLTWHFTGGAHFVGNVMVLPIGSTATSDPYSFYTVEPNDFLLLSNHVLKDEVEILWQDLCDANVGCTNCNPDPNQSDTAPSQATVTAPLPCVNVDKSVKCDISMRGEVVTYTIAITNCGPDDLTKTSIIDTLLKDLTNVAPGACGTLEPNDSCTFDVNFPVPIDFVGSQLNNTITVTYRDEFDQNATDIDSVVVNLVRPDFTVTKSCLTQSLEPNQSALFNIVITNTGDVALDFTTNEPCLPPGFTLQPDGNATVVVSRLFDSNGVFNQIIAEANLPDGLCFQLPDNIVKEANDFCGSVGGATRTLGFWKTHCEYTEHVFEEHCGGTFNLGWIQINDINDLLGVLFANPAKISDGKTKRDALCKARVIASKQAVAALLNNCLDNGAPLPKTPAQIAAILGGTNKTAINQLGRLLDDYNNSGDDITIIDSDGFLFGNATPRDCAAIARIGAADCTTTQRLRALRLRR